MLTDSRLETYIEQKIAPQTGMCHLANGSIDYRIYDRRARACRAHGFANAGAAITGLIRRVFAGPGHAVPKIAGTICKTTDQAKIVPAE